VSHEFVEVSLDQVDVLRPCIHGVNEQVGAAVEPKHDQMVRMAHPRIRRQAEC
jgi:hypothetical protein